MKLKTPLFLMTASFLLTAGLMSIAAPAQVIKNHNSNAPVDFSANQIELQDRADRVIMSGGATVTQAGLTINASRMTAAYTNNGKVDVNRFDAIGGVVITKDDLRATSNAAIYDVDSAMITLLGNVALVQGTNRLNGGRIVIDLRAGRSTISGGGGVAAPGSPVTSSSKGRVSGTFTVPQRKN
jgi:lipopolysaccharide export system protein LptA